MNGEIAVEEGKERGRRGYCIASTRIYEHGLTGSTQMGTVLNISPPFIQFQKIWIVTSTSRKDRR